MSSAFVDLQEILKQIATLASAMQAAMVEAWLKKHWSHKPGPELLHYPDLKLKAKCHGCKEEMDFEFKVPSLD